MKNTDQAFIDYVAQQMMEMHRAIFIVTDTMPFAYTISDLRYASVELILLGSNDGGVRDILHAVARMLPNDPKEGYKVRIPGAPHPVKLVYASPKKALERSPHYRAAEYHLDRPFRLMQVLLPSENGKFPGDPDCPFPTSTIPLIGA
jgi:hypothetical protein